MAGGLIATADNLRGLYSSFGLRPYRVYSIVYQWTGGEIGRGERRLLSYVEMTPTPKLTDYSGIAGSPRSGGIAERGNARLTQVSARYTEAQIMGMFFANPLAKSQEGWIEVQNAHDGPDARRRRFAVKGVPYYAAEKMEWRVDLVRQDQDRNVSTQPIPVPR